jgi:repressor LexA
MVKLTKKQKAILDFIAQFSIKNNFPPTYLDICNRFKLTIGTVQDHISALIRKKYLDKKKDLARGFKILRKGDGSLYPAKKDMDQIPLYGNVAAGQPLLAANNIEGYVYMEKTLKGHHIHFALKVKGDSMIDSGIYDGDIAIVRKQETAESGDLVIALLDDEATLKTFKRQRIKAYLEASNPKYESITNRPFMIIGKVIELRRNLEAKKLN